MTMASLDASLLARKGTARPIMAATNITQASSSRVQFIPHDVTAKTTPKPKATRTAKTTTAPVKKSAKQKPTQAHRRKHKSVRLSGPTDKDLRLLAAGLGVSQQSIMERAISDYLEHAYKAHGCICRRKINA